MGSSYPERYAAEMKAFEDAFACLNQTVADADSLSVGEQFVQHRRYSALKSRGMTAAGWTTGPIPIQTKATLTEAAGSGGQLVQPQVLPGILPLLLRPLTIADLLPTSETYANTVRDLRAASFTDAAAATAEGALKPESAMTFDQVDEPVR